jgi:hypothetical protein
MAPGMVITCTLTYMFRCMGPITKNLCFIHMTSYVALELFLADGDVGQELMLV